MVMFTLTVLFTVGAVSLLMERNKGIFRRLASSPMSRGSVVLGMWGARMGLGLIQMLWDRGETNGYAAHIASNPLPNTPAKRVLICALTCFDYFHWNRARLLVDRRGTVCARNFSSRPAPLIHAFREN